MEKFYVSCYEDSLFSVYQAEIHDYTWQELKRIGCKITGKNVINMEGMYQFSHCDHKYCRETLQPRIKQLLEDIDFQLCCQGPQKEYMKLSHEYSRVIYNFINNLAFRKKQNRHDILESMKSEAQGAEWLQQCLDTAPYNTELIKLINFEFQKSKSHHI